MSDRPVEDAPLDDAKYGRTPEYTHVEKPRRLEDMTPEEAHALGFKEGAKWARDYERRTRLSYG